MSKHYLRKLNCSIIMGTLLISNLLFAQTKPVFDAPSWKPPYQLPLEGWGIERFLIPIDFAPKIPYTGVEDLRFTNGWSDVKSPEYWSYAFLWIIDGNPTINASVIGKNLTYYYDGLVARNIEKRNIPTKLVTKTIAAFQQIKAQGQDQKTFAGTISMLDYMSQKPMVLYALVHLRKCSGQNKTILFHQISPQQQNDNKVWLSLKSLWTEFKCSP
ncbi:hypothetical protein [Pedobacter sp. L105]|uniref:hypothetical protein n=1 Tax=Pedobacter sp. L105 TaxID=1641871 RepID=UPI00131E58ED|nr:hypothetical protein [Pedobacter sp. L105]